MAWGGHRLPKVLHSNPIHTLPFKHPYSPFQGWLPARRAACSRLLPPLKPHAVRLTGSSPATSRGLADNHGRMVRGGHGLSKVSPGPAIPNPSTPCGQATPETALRPFRGWPARRAGGLRPSSTPLITPRHTPTHLTASCQRLADVFARDSWLLNLCLRLLHFFFRVSRFGRTTQ
jgi:hypothetical protein